MILAISTRYLSQIYLYSFR